MKYPHFSYSHLIPSSMTYPQHTPISPQPSPCLPRCKRHGGHSGAVSPRDQWPRLGHVAFVPIRRATVEVPGRPRWKHTAEMKTFGSGGFHAFPFWKVRYFISQGGIAVSKADIGFWKNNNERFRGLCIWPMLGQAMKANICRKRRRSPFSRQQHRTRLDRKIGPPPGGSTPKESIERRGMPPNRFLQIYIFPQKKDVEVTSTPIISTSPSTHTTLRPPAPPVIHGLDLRLHPRQVDLRALHPGLRREGRGGPVANDVPRCWHGPGWMEVVHGALDTRKKTPGVDFLIFFGWFLRMTNDWYMETGLKDKRQSPTNDPTNDTSVNNHQKWPIQCLPGRYLAPEWSLRFVNGSVDRERIHTNR